MSKEHEVIELSKSIVKHGQADEYEVFKLFSSSLYASITEEYDVINEHSYFGEQADFVSYSILAVIAWIANDVKKESIKLTKYFLAEYFKDNKQKIYDKFNTEKYKIALRAIENYLNNETGNK